MKALVLVARSIFYSTFYIRLAYMSVYKRCHCQGDPYPQECGGGLYFDPVTYNCNWPFATQCHGRPVL